ncbi:unnamed protein product [Moneuplotes crassus]|uniref:Uncharacterized protein n=1 Tax=Euplotes crassus TaxID=5936 RepID=A0AAD1Y8K6_EUPCR|nr:unnamed protein product [Moneuplotes crassus]
MFHDTLSMTGEIHPCFTFKQRLINCVESEPIYTRMCRTKKEDYNECHTKEKYKAAQYFIGNELHKQKIYSLPVYDEATDTFKDGPLPKDADGYFNTDKQVYYSDPQ